jgi:hypothetical protein
MKKLFTLLMLCATFGAFAQNNPGLILTLNGTEFINVSASFGAIMDYDTPICAEVVVMDSKGGATPTAITKLEGCDDILNAADMKGKIVLIRRGTCEFGAKALNAEKAGAIAVIIYNRQDPNNLSLSPNIPVGMAAGAVGADVTIPTTMIGFSDGEATIASIKAGTKVTACFTRPGKLIEAVYGNPWGNMTPLSQVDTFAPTVSFINRKESLKGIVSNIEITEPKGKKVLLTRTHDLSPLGGDSITILGIDNYLPKEIGTYNVKYFGTFLKDTVRTQFAISDYTFANDLGGVSGNAVTRTPAQFGTDLRTSNVITYHATGSNASKATYVSFGLRNAAKMVGRTIDISLLETDADRLDAITGTTLNIGDIGDLIGDVLTYKITGKEDPNQLIYVKLKDGAKIGVDLKENTPYAVAIQYDGSQAKDSVGPEWSLAKIASTRWPDIDVFGAGYMTGTNYYTGWSATEDPIARLHIDQFTIGTKNIATLGEDEVSFFPNPTADVVNVKLALKETAKSVQLGIMDITGRILNVHTLDVQNGIVPINISNYPSGTYFFTVKTDKAFTTEKIVKD